MDRQTPHTPPAHVHNHLICQGIRL